jgi:hypothetical protein
MLSAGAKISYHDPKNSIAFKYPKTGQAGELPVPAQDHRSLHPLNKGHFL